MSRLAPPVVLAFLCVLPLSAQPAPLTALTCSSPPVFAPIDLDNWAPGLGTPLLKVTLDTPQTRCNDGSPAVMYIRPAEALQAGETDGSGLPSDNWWIHLSGGGSCSDVESCFHRWCSSDGKPTSVAAKMSSLGTQPAVFDAGVFDRRHPDNTFDDWNHVIVYYCSSDFWAGSANHERVNTSAGDRLDIEFRGAEIVNTVFQLLVAGGVGPDPDPTGSNFWTDELPPLDEADTIVFSGDSAGAYGVRFHADRLADEMLAINPAVEFVAVMDAGFPATLEDLPASSWVADSPGSFFGVAEQVVVPESRWFHGQDDVDTDASCVASPNWVLDIGTAECFESGVVLEHHVTTPFFVRMDIDDTVAYGRYGQWLGMDSEDYNQANFDQLDALSGVSPAASVGIGVGVMGTNCDAHVTLRSNVGFYDMVNDLGSGAVGTSFHDLVVDWLGGGAPEDIQTMTGVDWDTSPSAVCP